MPAATVHAATAAYQAPISADFKGNKNERKKMKKFTVVFRDVDKRAADGKDVTLGDGVAQIREMLAYMKQKGVKPIHVFEYERDQDKPLKYIVPGLELLNKASSDLK